jgi:acylphosphatase
MNAMPPNDNTRLHVLIDGHVQGVGFRAFVFEIANSQELTGWVRNTYEGKVEVTAEGPRENLEILFSYIKRGPRSAFVTEARPEWDQATGEFDRFTVQNTA